MTTNTVDLRWNGRVGLWYATYGQTEVASTTATNALVMLVEQLGKDLATTRQYLEDAKRDAVRISGGELTGEFDLPEEGATVPLEGTGYVARASQRD